MIKEYIITVRALKNGDVSVKSKLFATLIRLTLEEAKEQALAQAGKVMAKGQYHRVIVRVRAVDGSITSLIVRH